jgi:hypothetical protein
MAAKKGIFLAENAFSTCSRRCVDGHTSIWNIMRLFLLFMMLRCPLPTLTFRASPVDVYCIRWRLTPVWPANVSCHMWCFYQERRLV